MKQMRGLEMVVVVALVVFVGWNALPTGTDPAGDPSYEALRPLLQAGEGKGIDGGVQDIFQMHSVDPVGWIWAEDGTVDGMGTEYRVFHSSFVHPGADDDDVTVRFVHVPNHEPQNVEDFLSWIVQRSPHVQNANQLDVHLYEVSTVQ